ncbi:electron transfer flavo protein alpha-subunit [Spathaspora passalidarum NRRL Y-27907]|uniref:Probable electron transfer flavoprotein subunit alpha n=1 Tax=Spathaspora passalidarum (strain NRRL Y-27907 / 11-Y1) TaxID=619300 RepID=G3APA3_SPAPN|nr:electron transfer flavo protein alpha-subunit [Spathaspora passalidarum NRRL Y-27907]EGW32674.1 electron transfer flavo protein alpha-subunit [Spathaspora passalidarum NRRL Y-27907]
MSLSLIARRYFSSSKSALNTLVFIESNASGATTPASLSAITAATQLGKPVTALVVGSNADSIAPQASKAGVSKVLVAKDAKYDHYLAEEVAPLVENIIKESGYTHFITPASSVGKSVLPRVAASLDVQPISDIVKIVNENTFVRPIYAGNALATVKSKDSIILASVRASAFAPVATSGSAAPIEEVSTVDTDNRTEFVSEELVSDGFDLSSSKIVVAGGRGLKNKATFDELMNPLASKLKAAIGASRAAVDSGFCDNSLQIGQTGKIIAPELYIGVGISGAIQHLAGMKDSKTIVAINKDPDAPIFNVADIGLVGDLNEVIPELTKKL